MSWGDPSQSKILFGIESVYGATPGSPAAYQVPFDSCDLGVEDPPQLSETLGNGNGNPSKPGFGNKDDQGNIVVPLELIAFGHWLKLLMGTPTSVGSADPYTHTFKIGNSLPSAYIDIEHPDLTLYYLHNGVMADTFNLSFGNNQALTASIKLLASKETKGASAVDAAPTDISVIGTRFYDSDLTINEGGSSISYLEKATLNFENRLDSAFGLGGAGVRTACQQRKRRVYGNITALFQDDTLLAKGRDKTESSLEFILTSGTHSLTFKVPELLFSHKSPPVNGSAGLRMDLTFEGYYHDDADASAFKAVLVNDQAGTVYA